MIDKTQVQAMPARQKMIAVIVVIVLIFLAWQVIGLFRGDNTSVPAQIAPSSGAAMSAASPGGNMPVKITPKPAPIPPVQPLSDREIALMRLQQQTQDQYLQAVNELQILKVKRDIAVTDKDISSAQLTKVEAEKKIVDMLAPQSAPVTNGIKEVPAAQSTGYLNQEVRYTVISVSQLQYRWGAVMGYKGSLFNVHTGDILPPDGSKVIAISKSGVTLQKNGVITKVSLVPAI